MSRMPEGRLIARAVGVVSLALIAIALLWQASEAHYRGCIAQAEARYPAVAVSAFGTRTSASSGPLKLSFVQERTKAVAGCHHL